MNISVEELKQTPRDAEQLLEACNRVMRQIDGLQTIDVRDISPISHPIPAIPVLRDDHAIADSVLSDLKAAAPLFADDYYLVPQIIKE